MELEFENGDKFNLYDVDSGDLKNFVLIDINGPCEIKEYIVRAENSISKRAFLIKLYHEWIPSLENEFEFIMANNVYEDTFKDSVFRLSNNIYRIKELIRDEDMMKQKVMLCPSREDIKTIKFFAESQVADDGSKEAKHLMYINDECYKCIKAGEITEEVLDYIIKQPGFYISVDAELLYNAVFDFNCYDEVESRDDK